MKSLIKKYNSGFTLVETLVAVSILSLSILATFTAVQSGLQSSILSKDQVTAFYLTQEALEYIKNIRDQNALNTISGTPTNWLHTLAELSSDPCYFGKTCTIDVPLNLPNVCSGGFGTCPGLREDPSTGLYGYTSAWPLSNFKREIQFQSLSANEVRVIINMSWTTRGMPENFQTSEILFNRG